MPGFDGTGPLGQGPMTGGGRGMCVVPDGNLRRTAGMRYFGRGFGYGRGFGRALGRGCGFGRGFGRIYGGYPYAEAPYSGSVTSAREMDMLRAEAEAMREDLDAINKRIREIETAKTSEGNK